MSTNDEIRQTAEEEYIPEVLPRDKSYRVMAARPSAKTEPVTDEIEGPYHAKYMLHLLQDEHGYAGVSFHLSRIRECDECGYRGVEFNSIGRRMVCGECGASQ